ncbi:MAG: hypothetical protein ACRCYA_13935 [Cetobacterium sp.]|uniref:hypothetical protein n=1 Tax=Cetobacterium sp. TaxID=2071632 RepID=UPI003F345249
MRSTTTIDDMLSVTMGTTVGLIEIREVIEKDYTIDEFDDKRREHYIITIRDSIERLKKFAEDFQNTTFTNWVKRHINFLEEDLKQQLFYEELSDNLRDYLLQTVDYRTNKIKNENHKLDKQLIMKNCKENRTVG